MQLIVEFVDHADNYVYEKTDLPDKCILKVSGEVLMNETAYRIGRIFNFHIEVNVLRNRYLCDRRIIPLTVLRK